MKIGFIGLGIMGKPMAQNLLRAGYGLLVNDRQPQNLEAAIAAGAKAADQKTIGEQCDVVLTMLPNSPHVREVMLGADGVAAYMRSGATFIDMSSISPVTSREIAEVLAAKNIEMLDAPVSGGEPKAIDGTLSFMVGGKQSVFEAFKPLLQAMGSSVVYCGGIGAGNTTKLANQVIVASNIAALSEALVLATKLGVQPQDVFQAIRGGLAGSTVMEAKAPMMLERNFQPGFRIDLHIKDLTNAVEASRTAGMQLPMAEMILEMMKKLQQEGLGGCDHSALLRYYEEREGVEVKA